MTNKKKLIPISQLGSLLTCEYRIYLKYVVKAREKITKAITKGKETHEKLDKKHKEVVNDYKEKVKKIIKSDKPIEEKTKEIKELEKPEELNYKREFTVKGKDLMGRIDEIQFNEDNITVIDDKKHTSVFDSDKVQVFAYIMTYIEEYEDEINKKYPNGVKFIAKVRSYTTDDIIFEQEYDEESRQLVRATIERYNKVINEKVDPKPTTVAAVCRSCSLKDGCKYMVKSVSVDEFLSR